ncbi:MAG: hypothetical protein IBX46_00345 [Desulfuromonadales bacterium]|nr:hypothetical protein [Desulfuromonadales bacterium]
MEQALFLPSGETPDLSGVDRLYLGAEFCPWTFPDLVEIRRGMQLARNASLPLTLVTPVFGEFFLASLQTILAQVLPSFLPADEIVISDWGAFLLIKKIAPHQEVVLGRALSGQKRGPQILDNTLAPEQLEYFQASRFHSSEVRLLLSELGVRRIELDYPPQGIAAIPPSLRGTLHAPFAMVTSSRNCPFRRGGGDRGCPAGCGEVFTLSSPQSPLPLLQGGNTQFIEIGEIPDNLTALGIDRLVTHVILPR